MTTRVDYLYWAVAHDLIVHRDYRLFKLSPSHNEMWLEGGTKKNQKVIRLVRVDLDWGNHMQRDLDRIASIGDQLRKKVQKRHLTIENIYFSTNAPVDDYEFLLEKPIHSGKNKQTVIHSTLIEDQTDWNRLDPNHPFVSITMNEPLSDIYNEEEIEERKRRALSHANESNKKEQQLFNAATPFFTYVFIVIQLAMFYVLEKNGGSTDPQVLIEYGAKYNPGIEAGEWWRFFTPMVLHIGFLHLFMNTFALFYLGPLIERIFGRSRFLFIYLFAGFVGSLMSFVFTYNISAGASGAIFGCFGALLYFGVRYPKLFFRTMGMNVLVVIGINVVFGFSVPGIDNAGHLGGLAGGFLAAGIVSFPKQKGSVKQLSFSLVAICFVVLSLFFGFNGGFDSTNPMAVNTVAQESIQNGEYDIAYDLLTELNENGEATEETYFLLSFIEINELRYDEGKLNLEKAIEIREDFHEAHFNLALVYIEIGNIEEAKKHAEKALELDQDNEPYQQLVQELDAQ
ncbi:rhomboid family intramembrane serine protease [Jeotgalibacillus marinus]|uniref:Rhomboid family intramembrane serine protease n=1 Tax=Jeotgalibacillus marinus TaxID=86667 RepID=A0ABV3PZX9_9BACL